jgi:hypothetical protein
MLSRWNFSTSLPFTITSTLLVVAVLGPLGCSLSTSSKSASDSSDSSENSSASSASSSKSSSPESKEAQYRNDIRDFTASYVESAGRLDEFKSRVGELARERGITNWEETDATYEGIGRGLGRARSNQVELDTYTQSLAGADANKARTIKTGYEAEKD